MHICIDYINVYIFTEMEGKLQCGKAPMPVNLVTTGTVRSLGGCYIFNS